MTIKKGSFLYDYDRMTDQQTDMRCHKEFQFPNMEGTPTNPTNPTNQVQPRLSCPVTPLQHRHPLLYLLVVKGWMEKEDLRRNSSRANEAIQSNGLFNGFPRFSGLQLQGNRNGLMFYFTILSNGEYLNMCGWCV